MCLLGSAYAYVSPIRVPASVSSVRMQQKQQEEQGFSPFRNPFGQAQVPTNQQPVVEMQNLRRQPFYDWADDDESYKNKLSDLYKFLTFLISLPVAYTTFNVLPYELPQLILSANIGTFAAMLPFVLRLRVGWGFVSERLREKETYYEANQRALFATKDKEVRLCFVCLCMEDDRFT